jgi:cell division protein FtsW
MTSRQLRQFLLIVIIALLGLGAVLVYSASSPAGQSTYGNPLHFVRHHIVAIVIGLLLGLGCLRIPYRLLQPSARWVLLFSIVLLVLVDLFGQEVGGARRWFRLGRWSLQPSEFAQLSLVLYLSDLLARKGAMIQEFTRGLLPPLLITGIVAGLVLLQPDLGTAIVMGSVSMMLLAIAKARWQSLLGVAAVAAVLLVVLIAGEGYRRERLMVFLNPWQDPQGSGYQILQSYVALASGGVVGQGLGASLQKLFYLPSAHTDFIFAILGEELGLVGTTALLGLFALWLTFGFRLATLTRDLFSKYLICGLVGLVGLEAIVNIAVVTGLIPTKGLPLPLVSYGGTSMMMNLVACALIVQASRYGEHPLPQSALGQ